MKKKESEVQATRKEWSELTQVTEPVEANTVSADPLSSSMGPSRVQLVQRQA